MSKKAASAPGALNELLAIRDYVVNAQKLIKAGKMPDMTSLEMRTADLCRIIQDASSDIQQQCAPELKELAHQLDDCEQELRVLYENISARPDTPQ